MPRLAVVVTRSLLVIAGVLALAVPSPAQEQPRDPVRPSEYGRFESLGFRTPLSPNGKWIAVPVARVDGSSELRIVEVGGGQPVVVAEGRNPVFSKDSAWVAYGIGKSEAEREKLREDKKPARDGLGLLQLGSDAPETIEDVARFAFADSGSFLAMLRGAAEGADDAAGVDLLLRDLTTGTTLTLGHVTDMAWQPDGTMLAVTLGTIDDVGNGVHLYDAASGSLRVLDSGKAMFAGLAWRKDGADLAWLRAEEVEGWTEPANTVQLLRDVAGAAERSTFDPAQVDGFPAGMRIAEYRTPEIADDGSTVLFGIQDWHREPGDGKEVEADSGSTSPDTEGGVQEVAEAPAEVARPLIDTVEPSAVEVWHTGDRQVIPSQRVFKERLREATMLAGWHPANGRFVRIGTDLFEQVEVLEGGRFATETDGSARRFDNMFDTDWNDIWLVDIDNGERRKVIEDIGYYFGGSATGSHLLYFKDDQYWTYDIVGDAHHAISAGLPTSFVDADYDTPVRRQRPPYFPGGWLSDDAAVLLHDEFDVWAVRPDGAAGLRLTEGASEQIRHRVLDMDAEEPGVDRDGIMLSLYGEWTKREGFARVQLPDSDPESTTGGGGYRRLLWLDRSVSRLARAPEAEVYSYVVEDFDRAPAMHVAGADLASAPAIVHTNDFLGEYAWGRSELIDYESDWGRRLQGALFYPANYEPGKKYPMIVYVYERLSQSVHDFVVPSERSPYNTSVFNAEGYFVLRPDIVFRNRLPGTSAVECIVPAVQAAIDTGMVDPDRVGLVGHSWGGYEASYVPTQTDIFAASVAGAPLTNFFSMFGTVHWNQGLPETDHFETGQARMEVPYWQDMEAYVRESPIAHITELETPMMIFFGDKDGTVDWHQGVEMYNYARRAGKFLVMLVYPGENHSAREKNNQVDYHHRVLQWFGHFLKRDPAADWILEGKPLLERERDIAARKAQRQK